MWILLMILYVAETNITHHTRLMTYDTLEECTAYATSIARDTMAAYPGDTDTWFTCKLETV